jgi:hypothetical protein
MTSLPVHALPYFNLRVPSFPTLQSVMATDFVDALDGLTVTAEGLQQFTFQNTFPEFYSSSFAIFALGPEVSKSDLEEAAKAINEQAQAELGFDDSELAEMGYAAAVSDLCQLHQGSAPDVARYYCERFDKAGSRTVNDPSWYPLGFLGIVSADWRKQGVVLVFYDARHRQPQAEPIAVRAFMVDSQKTGQAVISLRQGDDGYENVKKSSVMA